MIKISITLIIAALKPKVIFELSFILFFFMNKLKLYFTLLHKVKAHVLSPFRSVAFEMNLILFDFSFFIGFKVLLFLDGLNQI